MTDGTAPYFLIPGFSQTPGVWSAVIDKLPRTATSHPLEIPSNQSFVRTAHDLGTGRSGIWAGYSLGGRLGLQLALDRPSQVIGLLLVSTNAGIAASEQRLKRRQSDQELAAFVEAEGTSSFLDRWLGQPMFATLDGVETRRHRMKSAKAIAGQLRMLGQGVQTPLWARLPELTMPVVVLAGESDRKYADLAPELVAAIGSNAVLQLVPDAGHALLQERPSLVAELLAAL